MKRNSLAVLVMFAEVEKIDNYIFFLAEQIRLAVQRIVVTVNGKLDDESVRKLSSCAEGIKIIQGKSKHNKKRFPIPGAFLQHVFGDLIPLIC